jgi:hypothetical protein
VKLESIPHGDDSTTCFKPTAQTLKEMLAETDNPFFLVIFAFQKHFSTL